MITPVPTQTPPSRLKATYFNDGKILDKLVSTGDFSRTIYKLLSDSCGPVTVVCHNGCPDGSWSGEVTAKSLPNREVRQLLQSYPMGSPDVEVKLLKQHEATGKGEKATIITADIMFDMATAIELLKKDGTTRLIQTDHHGGNGKNFLKAYSALERADRAFIDEAIECGRLVVNIDTTESGASHICKLLNKDKSTEQLQKMFDCATESQLASYRQFMKSYDLTTMKPGAVEEQTQFIADQVKLDFASKAILEKCQAGITDSFIQKHLLHFLMCYISDGAFNSKFHFAPLDSDPLKVAAPSFFDLDDPSYPGGRDDPNHRILMKVPENTKKFVTSVFEHCKDFNKMLKEVNCEAFILQVNDAARVLSKGKPVTYSGERFFAANITTRVGRFVQTLVGSKLQEYPDCQYAVLFGNKWNVSLARPKDSTLDLTESVKPWLEQDLFKSGGGHPEAVGMQMAPEQYIKLLACCHEAGIPLDTHQLKMLGLSESSKQLQS